MSCMAPPCHPSACKGAAGSRPAAPAHSDCCCGERAAAEYDTFSTGIQVFAVLGIVRNLAYNLADELFVVQKIRNTLQLLLLLASYFNHGGLLSCASVTESVISSSMIHHQVVNLYGKLLP